MRGHAATVRAVESRLANSSWAWSANQRAAGTAVAVFSRAADGSLTAAGEVTTGGLGSGGWLGYQGALVLGDHRRFPFVGSTPSASSRTAA